MIERLLKQLVDNNYQIDVKYLQNAIRDKELVIDSIRESYFWKIFNLHKEKKLKELWEMFDYYISNYSIYGASHWHSEILKIADRFMEEVDSWRFYAFLQKWDISNFQNDDWHEEIQGDFKNKPLVIKVLKKVFKLAKLPENKEKDFGWILPLYQKALRAFNNDIWILREYATILNITGENQEAIGLYKNVILELNDQAYVWHEFAELLVNSNVKISISMLCKAIYIQKNEDFLGGIHMFLAKLLIKEKKFKESKTEINAYKNNRIKNGWKISEECELLEDTLREIDVTGDNSDFYKTNIKLAEEYIYSDIPWIDFLLYDKWKNKKQQEISSFTSVNEVKITAKSNKFKILKDYNVNSIVQIKTYYDTTNNKHIALQVQKSTCTYFDFIEKALTELVIVDHINENKKLFHYVVDSNIDGIIRFSQTDIRPNVGDFMEIKYFKTYSEKQHKQILHILDIRKTKKKKHSLINEVKGKLNLKYKVNGRTIEYQDVISEGLDITKPDFAFIDDYYVPKFLLRKHHIYSDCEVMVKALFNGEKWSVFELRKQ